MKFIATCVRKNSLTNGSLCEFNDVCESGLCGVIRSGGELLGLSHCLPRATQKIGKIHKKFKEFSGNFNNFFEGDYCDSKLHETCLNGYCKCKNPKSCTTAICSELAVSNIGESCDYDLDCKFGYICNNGSCSKVYIYFLKIKDIIIFLII